jgi:hypothetical protein
MHLRAASNQSNTYLFLHLLVFLVLPSCLTVFVALKRKAIDLALRDKGLLCSARAIKFLCEHIFGDVTPRF